MKLRSIRLRLVVVNALALALALAAAAWGLALLFDRHAERVALSALAARADALTTALERDPDGTLRFLAPSGDPAYRQPLSGHYWQVSLNGRLLRSRSLWDYVLPLPENAPPPSRTGRPLTLPGPQGEALLVLDRTVQIGTGADATRVRISVAQDRAELSRAQQSFLRELAPFLAMLALALVAAGAVQVTLGLRPLAAIGQRVGALAAGRARRIGTDLPTEVLPLAREIDILLEAREQELERARSRAGDLAHGLKTPLQALLGEAIRLRARGEEAAARGIEEVASGIQRHVDRELMRARIMRDRAGTASDPAEAAQRLIRVLRRTERGSALSWQLEAEERLLVRLESADLTEALGPLMENAATHAAGAVRVRIGAAGASVAIHVSDDGPGAPDIEAIRARGVRFDTRSGGHGLGLAIAGDIVETAGGELRLRNLSPGFGATLILPAAV
ncbi:HAMP domain-containing sensor histidine kinase [Cereibacter johrii]|uniref:sensor histidine kinase n=1 Tax=Cereibacter johrii TaxID=445629 RepID=UPI002B25C8E9|nr:HAMP domain-containing sensor histidine kinase [Cereibacter johrii]MEA5160649.1 HAMP domain-containing sensor histidine kinase [Cereibacter johrii]